MCEINPAHTMIMRLEVFTSDRRMSSEQFKTEVMERLLGAEMSLNADGKFRFHIHEDPSAKVYEFKDYEPVSSIVADDPLPDSIEFTDYEEVIADDEDNRSYGPRNESDDPSYGDE